MSTTSTTRPASTSSTDDPRARPSLRPWYRWMLTALAFPPAGYIAHVLAGRVDSVSGALLNGAVAGAGIGTAQWVLLRHRGISLTWVPATAVGLGAGLALGAPLVSYRTDITSLALMGAVSGLAVGITQGATFGDSKRMMAWSGTNAVLWALGWTVTTAAGIDVSQQWAVFGLSGCLTLTVLQSMIIGAFVPARPPTVPA